MWDNAGEARKVLPPASPFSNHRCKPIPGSPSRLGNPGKKQEVSSREFLIQEVTKRLPLWVYLGLLLKNIMSLTTLRKSKTLPVFERRKKM